MQNFNMQNFNTTEISLSTDTNISMDAINFTEILRLAQPHIMYKIGTVLKLSYSSFQFISKQCFHHHSISDSSLRDINAVLRKFPATRFVIIALRVTCNSPESFALSNRKHFFDICHYFSSAYDFCWV